MRKGLTAWVLTLSGLIVWAVHFGGLYAIFSWMDLSEANTAPGAWIAGLFSLACLLAIVAAAIVLCRERRLSRDLRWIALAGVIVAGLAILFQTAPLFLI